MKRHEGLDYFASPGIKYRYPVIEGGEVDLGPVVGSEAETEAGQRWWGKCSGPGSQGTVKGEAGKGHGAFTWGA